MKKFLILALFVCVCTPAIIGCGDSEPKVIEPVEDEEAMDAAAQAAYEAQMKKGMSSRATPAPSAPGGN